MLARDIKKIFEELDEEAVKILSIMASKGPMTAYDVWRESKHMGREIPKRTVYGKFRWLRQEDRGYITEVEEKQFKRRLVKVYYDVTLKGILASLADERLSFEGLFLERIREKLHIPKIYEKAVKPIISIWAYQQSRIPKFERGKINNTSIFMSVLWALTASADVGIYSILKKEFKLPFITEFKGKFGITDEEYKALWRFLSLVLMFELPAIHEFDKRTLCFATEMAPTPYLSDCIEILPAVGIRVFWTTSKSIDSLSLGDRLFWLYGHKGIADLVSEGDRKNLDVYLKKFVSYLHPSWLVACFRRELDGICSLKGTPCSFASPLECSIVREQAEKFRTFLDIVIKRLVNKQ
jgi:DNA-binding PadR family transcriptional regulator